MLMKIRLPVFYHKVKTNNQERLYIEKTRKCKSRFYFLRRQDYIRGPVGMPSEIFLKILDCSFDFSAFLNITLVCNFVVVPMLLLLHFLERHITNFYVR